MSRGGKSILLAGLVLLCAAGSTAATPEEEIRTLFQAYKTALLEGDGAAAARLVDVATLDYFEAIKRVGLEGSEDELRQRPFVDRLLVITMRHQLEPAELEEMDLEDLLRHAIEEGWIGRQSIRQLDIGKVELEGDEASAPALTSGVETPTQDGAEPALRYEFVREDGEWKFRFHSLVASLNEIIASLTAQMGTDEDALIFMLVEQLSGRKVLPDVWQGFPGPEEPEGAATSAP